MAVGALALAGGALAACSSPVQSRLDAAAPPGIDVTTLGVLGDGRTDDTAAIQAALDDLAGGGTLSFPAGTYLQSAPLVVSHPGVRLEAAPGATLEATAAAEVAVVLRGEGTAIRGFTLTAPAASERLGALEHHRIVLDGGAGQVVAGNHIRGGPGAGIFVYGATGFTISANTVEDTSADGIHLTAGASRGTVEGNRVAHSGDDCIAVVSYLGDGAIVSDITQTSNTCTDSYHARGFSVVGGRDIVIRDGRVEGTRAAGIYLASEDSFDTYAAQRVQVVGNHISGANTDPEIDHGAIFSSGRPGTGELDGEPVSLENEDLLLAGNVIEGTVSGRANIVVANGHHRRVAIEGARITGRPGIAAVELDDLAPDRYRLEANTFNGAALPDHAGPEPRPAR